MKYLVLLFSLCGVTLAFYRVDPLVSTKVGLIRGLRDDKGYSKFLGVPYGNVGSNIFGAATPHPGFDEIFEAYDDSNICLQMDRYLGDIKGTINCLNMDIYVPDNANSKHRLPVMVWIYGGGFIGGSASELSADPVSLLRHDVIVVAVNYRLGVFGFMCLDIPEVPGNTGLKDQALALKWINENIEAFGGDANQITVFGESAGGMSTNLHLFSLSEKLFHRAIIQSGPANSYWTIVESDNTIPIILAAELGFNTTDVTEALSFLVEENPHTIAKVAQSFIISNAEGTNQPLTKPCVEQEFEGIEHFLTEHPMNMKSNKASTIPVIIGYNNIEFGFEYANVEAKFFDTYDFSQHFALGFDMSNDLTEALEFVKHFYIGDEDISEDVRWEIIDFGSDFIFNHPTQRMIQKLQESGAKTVYQYVYSYGGNDSMNKTWSGATHGEELSYLFDRLGAEEKTSEDQVVIDRLTELWTNFAKYGMLLGLPRYCSASGMFAKANTDGFLAIIRKRVASLVCRVRDSANCLLNTIIDKLDCPIVHQWNTIHMGSRAALYNVKDPTPATSELIPVKWTPVSAITYPYLAIDSDLNLKSRPFYDRMAFWDLFYKQYGKYQKGYKATP